MLFEWFCVPAACSADLVMFVCGTLCAGGGQWQWDSLGGCTVLVDHFFQPMALFRTALRCQGVAESSLTMADVGQPAEIEAAFRGGQGDVVHLQGPGPQQLEEEVSELGPGCLSKGE